MIPLLPVILIALVISFILTPFVRRLAFKCEVIDYPGGRRVHVKPTPRWGGIAIYAGFMAAVVIALAIFPNVHLDRQMIGILAGGTLVALVGLIDDKQELKASLQATAIVVAAVIVIYCGVRIQYVTNPFADGGAPLIWLKMWSIPITIIWIFGVTKTIDLMDGIDGLAAGISAIAAATLLIMAVQLHSSYPDLTKSFGMVAIMAAALLGASLGFLRYNFPPASIFMGTIGAQFMGFIIASTSIIGAFKLATLVAVAVPLLALAVPILDTAFVVIIRFINHRPLHQPDKTHVHHRLLDRGFSPRQTLIVLYSMTALLSGIGLMLFVGAK